MAHPSSFRKLLEPGYIGGVRFRNRIIKTAAETHLYNEDDGYVNDACVHFYETMAKGGAGAVYVEGPAIAPPLSKIALQGLQLDDDKYIESFRRLTDAVHKHGCPTFVQLLHAGPWHQSFITGLQPVASSVPPEVEFADWGFEAPRPLTLDEIEELVDKFASAAVRAEKAGFDGVDVNAGGAHLLCTFLSGYLNRREDRYGGGLENRARIVTDIIKEVKKRLGNGFPVGVVMNGIEVGYRGGLAEAVQEGCRLARILELAGADSLQVRSYRYGYIGSLWPEQFFYPEPFEPLPEGLDWRRRGAGAFAPLAAAIKGAVSIPVITVGRLDAELGEKILRQGKADFIGMCRRLFADPELPNKLAAGRPEDVAPCTACLFCLEQVRFHKPIRCRINASLGRVRDFALRPAPTKKRVLVVGGGPAGMEAARTAALRGHGVTLCTAEHRLGGLLPVAATVKGTGIEDLPAIVRYYGRQLHGLGVDVRLDTVVCPSFIEELEPDAVILAGGGMPAPLQIPGIDSPIVRPAQDLHRKVKLLLRFMGPDTLNQLTRLWMPVGRRVVIVGGAMQGCELAEFLVLRGRRVTILEKAPQLGEGLGSESATRLFKWMHLRGVTMVPGVRAYKQITKDGIAFVDKDDNDVFLEVDTVLTALPFTPDTRLLETLTGRVPEVHAVGDCREPGLIAHAVADGAEAGRKV